MHVATWLHVPRVQHSGDYKLMWALHGSVARQRWPREMADWVGLLLDVVLERLEPAPAAAVEQSALWWRSKETEMACNPETQAYLGRRGEKRLSEERALARCTGAAHYFPGDRWQRLQMTGYWLRCQRISVNYDCNKALCVWQRGLNKHVSRTSRDIALIIIMAIFLY